MSLQLTMGREMPPTGFPGPYPYLELEGCVQMLVGGGGQWVGVVEVAGGLVVVVAEHGKTVVVVLGGLPPWPGLWFQQSPLEHFPNKQVELQYC